jgi:hypothetical protein
MSSAQRKRRRSSSPPRSRKQLHTETDEDQTTPGLPETDPTSTVTNNFDAEIAELLRSIGDTTVPEGTGSQTTVSTTPVITLPITTAPIPLIQGPRRKNPFVGKPLKISGKWGTTVHEQMHFYPTDQKPDHGVWGTPNVAQVQKWVRKACAAIRQDSDAVVASKPGAKGGYNFLVDMGEPVGYVSGSNIQSGTEPVATHLAVYVNKKGYPVTAFPCTPGIFQ